MSKYSQLTAFRNTLILISYNNADEYRFLYMQMYETMGAKQTGSVSPFIWATSAFIMFRQWCTQRKCADLTHEVRSCKVKTD